MCGTSTGYELHCAGLWCVEVPVCKGRSLKETQCIGLKVCGGCGLWEGNNVRGLPYVG